MKNNQFLFIVIVVLVLTGLAILFVFYLGGFGKCKFGEAVYFQGTKNETCAPFGTKIDPVPNSIRVLKITRTDWSGWNGGSSSKEDWTVLMDGKTDEINLGSVGSSEGYVLKIESYNQDNVSLSVNGLGLKQGEGLYEKGIDLTSCKNQNFILKLGEKAELFTCTTDAGIRWSMEYL